VSQLRKEFEKAFDQHILYRPLPPDALRESALWAARWMAKYLADEAQDKFEGEVSSDHIRMRMEELS
jgi:hypothetical protein